jgi:hypothetical protein
MYNRNVISKKRSLRKEQDPEPYLDTLVRGTDPSEDWDSYQNARDPNTVIKRQHQFRCLLLHSLGFSHLCNGGFPWR